MAEARNRNVQRKRKSAFTYPPLLHDMSFVLGYLGSNSAHAYLAKTLVGVLPGRAYCTKKHLESADVLLFEPGFYASRFAAARRFYDALGYSSHVYFTSTDATAVRQQLTVRRKDDALLGLCTVRAVVAGESLQGMLAAVTKYGLASLADLFLLNPIDTRLPSFALGVFPQCSTPKHPVLMERWSVAHKLLADQGMCFVAHGGDGDSAQLAAMLVRSSVEGISFESGQCIFSFRSVPAATGGSFTVSCPAQRMCLPSLGLQNVTYPTLHFQDPVHLLLKLRKRITGRDGYGVRIGAKGMASVRLLEYLLESEASFRTEIDHGLRKADLNPKDRMNFPAAERLFSERLIAALGRISDATAPLPPNEEEKKPPPGSATISSSSSLPPPEEHGKKRKKATKKKKKNKNKNKDALPERVPPRAQELAAFLHLGREAVFAFLGNGSPLERLYRAWFARYFADGWRAWLEQEGFTISKNFLSTNQYECIKLNAESLLLFYHWLCSDPKLRSSVPASVFGVGSQQNENTFRTTRYCSDPNFGVEEFLRRLTMAQEFSLVAHRQAGIFQFAKHHKHTSSDHIRRPPEYLDDSYTEHSARECLSSALAAANKAREALGMKLRCATTISSSASISSVAPRQQQAVPTTEALADLDDKHTHALLDEPSDAELEPLPEDFIGGDSSDDEEDDDNNDEKEASLALSDLAVAAAAVSALPGGIGEQQLHLAERTTLQQSLSSCRFYVKDLVSGTMLHKQRAAAMISAHQKQSTDRSIRVRQTKCAKK